MKNTRPAVRVKIRVPKIELPELPTEVPLEANYHDYHVTEHGAVYSFIRKRWLRPSVALKLNREPTGYLCQTLLINGKLKRFYIHRLVCEIYHGPASELHWVNHKDGNKANNYKGNLEWTTISENIKHSFEVLGRKSTGRKKNVTK